MNETIIYLNHETALPPHLANYATAFRLPENGVYLLYDDEILSLAKAGEKGRVCVDFAGGAAHYRRTKGGGELIGKAVNHTSQPTVWDATGGLGRDSFVLASLGLQVRTFERHAAVFALLIDGVARAFRQPEIAEIVQNIQLIHGNAADLFTEHAAQFGKPDVVYLDPMYPERQKSAAVKKEMAYFHELVGQPQCNDDEQLFTAARTVAKKRVVVKRPRLGEFLCGVKPAYQYEGKSTRFDVYLPFQAA
ncbi:class I SAM-dependent methyltransferase [Alysiella crassa]|uniref:Ribosomal RNA small subunit methyltransferase J n=1 Tax=Alysiella crassa TaxID=153491 RepID=A0A376BVG5_9NEIS|nr:class I SAM-dependent methyltransferase [Alysiella crassa]UOP06421.1 class I SAM-dependent methyltransferase [Alysiella crassa]SSY80940.1 Ribosomal RNA small subunit methyltransferase J [Alysiella crassa]